MRAYGNSIPIDKPSWGIEDRTGITVNGNQQLRCVSGSPGVHWSRDDAARVACAVRARQQWLFN